MAFFDELLDGGWFDTGSSLGNGMLASGVISGLTNIGGALLGSNGASDAASKVAEGNAAATDKVLAANKEARQEMRAAANRGIGYIDEGTRRYADTVQPNLYASPITLPQNRGLTQQQQIGRQDLIRTGRAVLAGSGLSGAGRAGTGVLLDQVRRYDAAARDANDADTRGELRRNQQVQQNTRQGLAGIYASSAGSKANTEIGVGNQMGSSIQSGGQFAGSMSASSGQAAGQAAQTSGNLWGNALTATGKVAGSTAGGIEALLTSPYSALNQNNVNSSYSWANEEI